MKFDFNTIDNFDDHIEKSIPNYNILIDFIKSISQYFYVENTNIYDLGCSTGKFLNSLDFNCNKIGIDNSNLLPNKDGFYNIDLNDNFEISNSCIVYSIFTMQFLSPSKRLQYLNNIYKGLNTGGAFLLCEKTYQEDGKFQEIMTFSHYDYKLKYFNANEIIQKEKDLRYIMKPNSYNEIYNMLKNSGFKNVTTFWQMFNFKGIIALK